MIRATGAPREVLIVDDEEDVRAAVARVLTADGYAVSWAEGADQALATLAARNVELVISDYDMPGLSGVDFLRLIRERYPNVCRVLLTGTTDLDAVVRCVNEGEVYRVIRKPWDNVILRVTVYFAFQMIDLQAQNRRLLTALREQLQFVRDVEEKDPALGSRAHEDQLVALLAEHELMQARN
jgi:DNA-binding NtrC family response regulator